MLFKIWSSYSKSVDTLLTMWNILQPLFLSVTKQLPVLNVKMKRNSLKTDLIKLKWVYLMEYSVRVRPLYFNMGKCPKNGKISTIC